MYIHKINEELRGKVYPRAEKFETYTGASSQHTNRVINKANKILCTRRYSARWTDLGAHGVCGLGLGERTSWQTQTHCRTQCLGCFASHAAQPGPPVITAATHNCQNDWISILPRSLSGKTYGLWLSFSLPVGMQCVLLPALTLSFVRLNCVHFVVLVMRMKKNI